MPTEYWQEQMKHEPTRQYCEKLAYIYRFIKPRRILEIGTGWGLSGTVALEYGVRGLVSIDPNNGNDYGARAKAQVLSAKGPDQTVEFIASFSSGAESHIIGKFDVVYIDGDHCGEVPFQDLLMAKDYLEPAGGYIVLDDFLHPGNWTDDLNRRCHVAVAVARFMKENAGCAEAGIYPTNSNGFCVIKITYGKN